MEDTTHRTVRRALVYGGAGALGRAVIDAFNAGAWHTTSLDVRDNPVAAASIALPAHASSSHSWAQHYEQDVVARLKDSKPFDAIVCVAGGWCGGGARPGKAFLEATETALRQSLLTSAVATALAADGHLLPGGLLLLTGAAVTTSHAPTPTMLAYGSAKAAVSHLARSLTNAELAGLPSRARAVAIMPVMLDTEANRAAMPSANRDTWTPLSELARQIVAWSTQSGTPASGTQFIVRTAAGCTTYEEVAVAAGSK